MIPAEKVHHPIAARLIARAMRAGEKRGQGDTGADYLLVWADALSSWAPEAESTSGTTRTR